MSEELGPTAEKKGLRLEVRVEPVSIEGDPLRLRQIFVNLLSNSIKFTDKGHVAVSVVQDGTSVVVSVKDSGRGIPDDQLNLIFDRFIQVNANQKGQTGTGLGLTIAKDLVQLHGGQITVSSTYGVGSTFQVRFEKDTPSYRHTENTVAEKSDVVEIGAQLV